MADDGNLGDRAEAFASLFLLMQHVTRRADQELADLGITSRQWLLLAILARTTNRSSPSLSEAAEQYGSSRQNVKQVALGLQARGFVQLVADPEDGRTTRIQLTERIAAFDTPAMVQRTSDMFDELFTGLSSDDVHELLVLLRRWLAALTAAAPREDRPA